VYVADNVVVLLKV